MTKSYEFDRYVDRQSLWRWRFLAPNGRIMADSAESYSSLAACDEAIRTIKREGPAAQLT